jgi:murein DD-endopeptidase MepM/ murein hydrolase activator NlpD
MRRTAIVGLSFSLGALTALGVTWYNAGAYRFVSPLPVEAPAIVATPAEPPPPSPAPDASTDPLRGLRLAMPLDGVDPGSLHDTFAETRDGSRPHEALDIMAPRGTPVRAVGEGHIEKLFTSQQGGLTIYQFDPSGTFSYYYAHLDSYAAGVHEGQPVRAGDLLGYVGSTGNASPDAPHLHFAIFRLSPEKIWSSGQPINPYPLLR